MPSTTPYDPSHALGNIVEMSKINAREDISKAQKSTDDAWMELNSMILAKRSLDMTFQEMLNMNDVVDDLKKLITELDNLEMNNFIRY